MVDVPCFVGIDVAKAQLDIAVRPAGERWAVPTDGPVFRHVSAMAALFRRRLQTSRRHYSYYPGLPFCNCGLDAFTVWHAGVQTADQARVGADGRALTHSRYDRIVGSNWRSDLAACSTCLCNVPLYFDRVRNLLIKAS